MTDVTDVLRHSSAWYALTDTTRHAIRMALRIGMDERVLRPQDVVEELTLPKFVKAGQGDVKRWHVDELMAWMAREDLGLLTY